MNQQQEKDIQILTAILRHAQGKLCSRFLLGIERSISALEIGSPREAIREQDRWFALIKEQKEKKRIQKLSGTLPKKK